MLPTLARTQVCRPPSRGRRPEHARATQRLGARHDAANSRSPRSRVTTNGRRLSCTSSTWHEAEPQRRPMLMGPRIGISVTYHRPPITVAARTAGEPGADLHPVHRGWVQPQEERRPRRAPPARYPDFGAGRRCAVETGTGSARCSAQWPAFPAAHRAGRSLAVGFSRALRRDKRASRASVAEWWSTPNPEASVTPRSSLHESLAFATPQGSTASPRSADRFGCLAADFERAW